jgi:hypothetical protein
VEQSSRPSDVQDLYVDSPVAVGLSLVLSLGFLVAAITAFGGNEWVVFGGALLAGAFLRQALSQLAWRRRVRRHIEISHPGEPLPTRGFL